MNGNSGSGIVPTIDLATNNNNSAYPVYPFMYGNNGNDGFFGGEGIWAIILLALLFNGGFGGFGGFGGGFGNMFEFPWLMNGQQEIMSNTNNGFDTLHLSNQIEGVRDGVNSLSNQICNSTSDITSAVTNGFYSAEISANARQIADMNQNFNNQIATLNGFNNLGNRLSDCCCENRLGIANLGSDIAREACATRTNDTENTQSILNAINNGIVSIKQQLCDDKIDAKNEKILDLQRQLDMADLKASQTAQNAFISQGFNNEIDALYNRLSTCPINTIPVYGNQRIFTCPNNNSCGCGNYYGANIM